MEGIPRTPDTPPSVLKAPVSRPGLFLIRSIVKVRSIVKAVHYLILRLPVVAFLWRKSDQRIHAEEWGAASKKLVRDHVLQRANTILRHAPILTFTPFSLFVVDSLPQPLKGSLPPANLVF